MNAHRNPKEPAVPDFTDPWATPEPPAPATLTRDDRVLLAAAKIRTQEDEDWLSMQVSTEWAAEILDAAYPLVESEEEIEALPWRTIIINDRGHLRERVIAPDNHVDHSGKPWSAPGADSGRSRVGHTSAQVALGGPWTVIHRTAA